MFISLRDLNMFVDVRGAGNRDAILFIHGFPFDHSMWRHQMAQFGAANHCIAPDLRGHGGTAQTESDISAVSMDTLADDLIGLLDQTVAVDKPITVCGLSLGGYIAFALWRKIPQRIERMILADTKATADTPEARANRQKQADLVALKGPRSISSGMLDGLLPPAHRNETIGMEVRRMIESTGSQGVIDTLGALANRPDSTSTLATITVPTLVIVGEFDKTTPIEDARYMHARLPHPAPLAIIAGAGHVSSLDNPVAFNLTLAEFLSKPVSRP